jgi:hypothetical protein
MKKTFCDCCRQEIKLIREQKNKNSSSVIKKFKLYLEEVDEIVDGKNKGNTVSSVVLDVELCESCVEGVIKRVKNT